MNEKKGITVSLGVWNGKERNKKEKVALGLQGSWLLPGGGRGEAPCNPKKSGNLIIHPTQPRPYLLPHVAIFVKTGLGRKRLVFMYSEIFFRPCERGWNRSSGQRPHWDKQPHARNSCPRRL